MQCILTSLPLELQKEISKFSNHKIRNNEWIPNINVPDIIKQHIANTTYTFLNFGSHGRMTSKNLKLNDGCGSALCTSVYESGNSIAYVISISTFEHYRYRMLSCSELP